MSVTIGEVTTFANPKPDKAQVLKISEECMEVFSAWERWNISASDAMTQHLMDEIADTIQACANLAAAVGVDDMRPAMQACEERNRERGRI